MRLRAILFAVIALGAAGASALGLADAAARRVEQDTGARIDAALRAASASWVRLGTDGLIVELSGEAPDETARLRALAVVKQLVDERRVRDLTSVRTANPVPDPAFALELLRNDDEISLIGLVPEDEGRGTISAGLARAGLSQGVTDMLETAAHPVPAGWTESLEFGLVILAELPRAKISVAPGKIGVISVADSEADRATIEKRLRGERPEAVQLALNISAPRPVISPFAVVYVFENGVGRFATCAAESVADVVEIGVAARKVGLRGEPDCRVGLGAPSPDWAAAVAHGLDALRELGGGRFALRDVEAVLTGPPGVSPEALSRVGARLDAELPDVFALSTIAPGRMKTEAGGEQVYAPRFNAELSDDGKVRMAGALQNATSREAVQSYAAALFGLDRVTNDTVIDPDLPEGWPGRVLVGVAALAELRQGALEVTPDEVSLTGEGNDAEANARVEALLAAKVGGAATVDVRYDAVAAKAAVLAARAAPEICAEEIAAILAAGSIQFAPGSAEIEPASQGVILAIADALRGCPRAAFEIGGHTDAQGGAETNQKLSEARATAVAETLRKAAPPLIELSARGYGSERPIADNGTEEGRSRNRRIEFTLIALPAPAEAAVVNASSGPR
ncbi:MAG: OmpA family protein [Amaricoccus sp.]|uniref:OmpA family protein n=1 Tax=Amaricoccus sp. TaxID=1872485 RepID=UPI003316248D